MTAEQDKFFTAIYLKRRKPLLEYATSVLHNHALAEEAVQQAFEIGWRKIEDFQNCPKPEGWIFNAVRFVVSNIESRQRTERRLFAFIDDYRPDLVAAPADHLPLRVHFGDLVDLPQFQIIYEMEFVGRSLAEIARDLGISEAACKKRAERARKYLQKKLK
jgi:DNA-directed RNA polymerase specialized sigma24 family protein